ncbi:hypothetical protein A1D29_06960 [Pasteurellaceae bacterium Orientalotternb1]|nr:hypothetical protein A1D29_06960 [Pasteurellaceae bacterium Orientalotternb1]
MLFKFLCVNRTKHTYNQEIIAIQADTEENARFQLSADYRLALSRPIAKISQNLTACNTKPRPTLGKVCGTAVHPTNTISFQAQGGVMRKDLPLQFDLLENAVERLNQPISLLNVLHNRTALDEIDTSELEQILKGIESLLQRQANDIQGRIDFILEKRGRQ